MFKNFFKLGKDSSGLNSISENFDVKQKLLSTCSVDNENYGNLMSGSVYTRRDLIISIIQRIDRKYFLDSLSDVPMRQEFEMLVHNDFNQEAIHKRISELSEQQLVVSREISRIIQSNHNDYMEEVSRLSNIQYSLQKACELSMQSRSHLQGSLEGIKNGGLGVLLSFRKMERLRSSLKQLSLVKTLQRADMWLRDRLNSGHFKEAAHCCMICLRSLNSFHNYSCCIDLSSKLLDIQQTITQKLDSNLFVLCADFQPKEYLNLMAAYNSLGKGETAIDKISLNYVQSIREVTKKTLFEHYSNLLKDFPSKDLDGIISHISDSSKDCSSHIFILTIKSLCDRYCGIIFSFSDISLYHDLLPEQMLREHFVSRTLLCGKFYQGKVLIWRETEKILNSLLSSYKYENIPYEILIYIVEIVIIYIYVGTSFCKCSIHHLYETIKSLSSNYFENYHNLRMDDLKLFLETESWELCPLPANFSLDQFPEFSFLYNSMSSVSHCIYGSNSISNVFDLTSLESRGQLLHLIHKVGLESVSSEDCLIFKHLPEYNSPASSRNVSQTILLTANTTLITLKNIGRYVQFMISLPMIALELFQFICLLYKFYLSVTNLYFADLRSFTPDSASTEIHGLDMHEMYYSAELNEALSQIYSELNSFNYDLIPNYSLLHHHFSKDSISIAFRQRIVGMESLIFLSEHLVILRPTIELIFRQNNLESDMNCISDFYSNVVENSFGLRTPVYCGIARYSLNYEQIFQKMVTTKWDIKELLSHHNHYIDLIYKEFERIMSMFDKISVTIPVPNLVRTMIFEECSSFVNKVLVEGFANGKRCTHQGRALMLFDFREYVSEIEKTCKIRVSKMSYVEDYINAYYLDDDELDNWTQVHKEYSSFQLNALSNCKSSFKKRTTNKFLNLIDKGTPPH